MTIPLRRIDLSSMAPSARAEGVIKAVMRASAGEARDIVEQARLEADRLLDEARARAGETLQQQQAELEQQMWRQAADYARSLGRDWDRSLQALESQLAELAGGVLRRLAEQVPAEERVRACVRQLVSQADAPDGGVLLVAEEDHAAVAPLAGTLPWPVQRSGELQAGQVRLSSPHGRWECDVEGALAQLLAALEAQARAPEEGRDA